MKLNSKMKKILLFAMLILALSLICQACGRKNVNPAPQEDTEAFGDLETAALEDLETAAPEDLETAVLESLEDLEAAVPEGPETSDTESQTLEPVVLEPLEDLETESEPEAAVPSETETRIEPETRKTEPETQKTEAETKASSGITVKENGEYSDRDHVALYIYTYGHLPSNFITKKDAQALGWPGGSLEPYAPGKSIGGDYFGNYENLLPKKKGRKYYECDIDTKGRKSRGAKRIIYSNDGLIFYTDDHYESFTQLYGGD